MNPPVIVIHGNSLEHVTDSYKRYLEGRFRKEFDLVGTPLRIELKPTLAPFLTGNTGPGGEIGGAFIFSGGVWATPV
jgi:GTP-binding protein